MRRALFALLILAGCPRRTDERPAPPPPREVVVVPSSPDRGAKNVVLFVGDGMGKAAIAATRFMKGAPLVFEGFEGKGELGTNSLGGDVTDSAAGATAIATGVKVHNGVISVGHDGRALPTALEIQAARGKRTGLVTTATGLTDATPAAFGAHVPTRGRFRDIASDYFMRTRPHALFGVGDPNISDEIAAKSGYRVVRARAELQGLADVERVSAQIRSDPPPLLELAGAALSVVARGDEGFFILIEHEGTDTFAHENDLAKVVASLLELEAAVAHVLTLVPPASTLVVVTADHETGGLVLEEEGGPAGRLPKHRFTTGGHTGAKVPVFATGPGAERVAAMVENTDLFALIAGL